jgi:hypothetical protein
MNKSDLDKLLKALHEQFDVKGIQLTVLDPSTMTQAEMAEEIRMLKEKHDKNNMIGNN